MDHKVASDNKRTEIFAFFQDFINPFSTLSYEIEITEFYSYIKDKQLKFYNSFMFIIMKSCNNIKEFRYRIKDGKIIEYKNVGLLFSYLNEEEDLIIKEIEYTESFKEFGERILEIKSSSTKNKTPEEKSKDDFIVISSTPWISFTGYVPALRNKNAGAPIILWGKFYKNYENKMLLPISLTKHHGLVDGLHIAKLNKEIDKNISLFIKEDHFI